MNETLWNRCVAFHGHSCPGLAIGFRAATEALSYLGLDGPAADEELVCVTENDACGVDAVQVITGCTMGKGNLIYRGTGKMAFSFYCRNSGKSVRLCLKALPDMEREERRRFILGAPLEQVFSMGAPRFPVPEKARRFASLPCAVCGEMTAEHMVHLVDGKPHCPDCFAPYDRGW